MKTNPTAAAAGPQPLTQEQRKAMEPLESAIGYLGSARETLELQRAKHSRKYYDSEGRRGNLHDDFFKRGTAAKHRAQATFMKDGRTMHAISSDVPLRDIADTHTAIANRIDEVKAAHEALRRAHPTLASKDGSMGRRNRKYKTLSGATQSLGNYHGKNVTDDGTPKTFGKGGRKTRKHKRKTKKSKPKPKRKHKRKTRKHKRKTRKHKRKTKKHRR